MQFLSIFIYICVNIFISSNGYGHSPTPTETSEGFGEKVLVFAQNRVENPHWKATIKSSSNTIVPPLQGYSFPSESQDGLFCYGKLPMALRLWTAERQTPQFLSRLSSPLDTWCSSLERTAATGTPVTTEAGESQPEPTDLDAAAAFEMEAQALVQQVQESLQQSIAAASKDNDAMEIHLDEEPDRRSKRPRSMEPFGGPPEEGSAGAHISSPRS